MWTEQPRSPIVEDFSRSVLTGRDRIRNETPALRHVAPRAVVYNTTNGAVKKTQKCRKGEAMTKTVTVAVAVTFGAVLLTFAGTMRDAAAQDYEVCMEICMKELNATFVECHRVCRQLVVPERFDRMLDESFSLPGRGGAYGGSTCRSNDRVMVTIGSEEQESFNVRVCAKDIGH